MKISMSMKKKEIQFSYASLNLVVSVTEKINIFLKQQQNKQNNNDDDHKHY